MSTPLPSGCPRCGSTAASRVGVCAKCMLAGNPEVDAIGHLEIRDEIGRGGMGSVWEAFDRKLGRVVAVKFLPDELAGNAELKARLEREARALAQLSHPNIVAIHELGEADGQTFLVMERVEGTALRALIPLPPARAIAIAAQVLDGLDFAHARGIVHRDVKPENVLVSPGDRVKVADFGIARVREADVALTKTGEVVGTPRYMAPEALAGAPPDPRADLFSVGVLVYEMIAGKPPAGSFDPLPGALDGVVRRALSPDPAKRHGTAREMKEALLAAGRSIAGDSLPPDERIFMRAVSMLTAAGTAIFLWALLRSITPRVIPASEVQPLVMIVETLPDGRFLSRARFETFPFLGAVGANAVAAAAWASIRAHWRRAGLHEPRGEEPLPQPRILFGVGLASCALYLLHRMVDRFDLHLLGVYIPVFGGVILLGCVHLFWSAVLESQRVHRDLRREPLLWTGFALAILPPVTEMLRFLGSWTP